MWKRIKCELGTVRHYMQISKRALSQLTADSGNPTLATLGALFKKFDLIITFTHNPVVLNAVAAKQSKASFDVPCTAPAEPELGLLMRVGSTSKR